MGEAALALSGTFRYRDYRKWPEGEHRELIGGIAYGMSPAPRLDHQRVVLDLGSRMREFLRDKACVAYVSPIDVLLPEQGQDDDETGNVVQPDIVVVCDPDKLANGRYIRGAPDLVVEILSPSTMKKDVSEKFELYERSGVREYWIIEPTARWLHRYVLEFPGDSPGDSPGGAGLADAGPGAGAGNADEKSAAEGNQGDKRPRRYGEALVRDSGDGLGPIDSTVLEGFSFVPEELFGD